MASRAVDTRARRYDPAETRARVLATAHRLFSANGFTATGTADIARAADVSEGSIFYHFGSKKNVLAELGRSYGKTMIDVMQGGDALADLDPGVVVARCIEWVIQHRDWEAITGEACPDAKPTRVINPEVEPFYREARQTCVDWVERHLRARLDAHGVEGLNIPVAASFTYVVVGEAIDATLSTDDPVARAAILAETIRFVRAACSRDGAGKNGAGSRA